MTLDVRKFTLRELDEQITVGPQRTGLSGEIRIVSQGVAQVFAFLEGNALETGEHVYAHGETRRNNQFEVPSQDLAITGIRVFYNVGAGWLRVERSVMKGPVVEVTVKFPGDGPRRR